MNGCESDISELLVRVEALSEQVSAHISQYSSLSRSLEASLDSPTSSGDTAWVLISATLVLLMTTPGIMLYYAGLVRLQNVLSTAMQGFSVACVVTLLWMCFGYSIAFSPVQGSDPSAWVFGSTSRFWLLGMEFDGAHQLAPTIPEPAFCIFQLAFAAITPALICGAFADRMKFISMLTSMGMWHLLVYCPIAHSHWHPDGFLYKLGVLDFAGGNVVHVSAGFSALVSAVLIGKRTGFGKHNFHPHNLLVSITGACYLWCGWYGFNAGSAFAADSLAGAAMLNTIIASSMASLSWMTLDLFLTGRPSIIGIMNGSLAGLVVITPGAGFMNPTGSFISGAIGGLACAGGVRIKDYFNFDDALDAFGIHGIGGSVGGVLLGLLARESTGGQNGAFYGNPKLLQYQLIGLLFTIGYSVVGTAVIMILVDSTLGLRVSATKELHGLDRSEHGSTMYSQMNNVPQRKVKDKRKDRRRERLAFFRGQTMENREVEDITSSNRGSPSEQLAGKNSEPKPSYSLSKMQAKVESPSEVELVFATPSTPSSFESGVLDSDDALNVDGKAQEVALDTTDQISQI